MRSGSALSSRSPGQRRQLKEAFKVELGNGPHESIPIAYRGVLYVAHPGATISAFNGATGAVIWQYKYAGGGSARAKAISIFDDMVYYTAPDNTIVALDARTGAERWKVKTPGGATRARSSSTARCSAAAPAATSGTACYVLALDAKTGKELWKFYTVAQDADPVRRQDVGRRAAGPAAGEPVGTAGRLRSVQHKLVFWGISNPMPNTRVARHNGNPDAVPYDAPADLYSNSTVALNPETGKLAWYYQHLPGDDWDEDYPHERTLIRTAVEPGPEVREVDQSRHPQGAAARHLALGRRGRRHVGARSRRPASSSGRRRSRSIIRTS